MGDDMLDEANNPTTKNRRIIRLRKENVESDMHEKQFASYNILLYPWARMTMQLCNKGKMICAI